MERPLTIADAESIIGGGLGWPSKMPCPSWGISASACPRGTELAEQHARDPSRDLVCGHCYAKHRFHYRMPSVANAHARRLAAIEHPRWAEAMALLVRSFALGYFRWFDSGDLVHVELLDKIAEVASRTRHVRHWVPTHEPYLVGAYLDAGATLPRNLTVRISADQVESAPTTRLWGLPTSTVHRHKREPVPVSDHRGVSIECPAYTRGGVCGPCRACWEPKVQNVSYLLNGGLRHEGRRGKVPARQRSKRLQVVA